MEGFPKQNNKPAEMSRRNFLFGAASVGSALATGPSFASVRGYENIEQSPRNENFEREVNILQQEWLLDREQVFFSNKITGDIYGPYKMQDFIVERTRINEAGESEMFDYLLAPAKKNETGHYEVSGVPGEWFNYVEKMVARDKKVGVEELDRHHVTADFVAALNENDEPVLQKGILQNGVRTKMDIAWYFASKPVRGAEDQTRLEFLLNEIKFDHPHMSELVQNEMRKMVACLCVKESKFNDDVESSKNAGGIAQFMPDTVKHLGYGEFIKERQKTKKNEMGEEESVVNGNGEPVTEEYVATIPFITQVEMLGKHVDNIYSEIRADGTEQLMEQFIAPLFPDWEAYERDFVVPCMINAYNCGGGTMRVAIKSFIETVTPEVLFKDYRGRGGKDIFLELTKFAKNSTEKYLDAYQYHSSQYTLHAYAIAGAFKSAQTGLFASNQA